MSTLADLVLNAVEPDLDDAALATELARLRARTAAAAEAAAVASRPSRPASARPVERPASARPQLADAILARADEVEDSIDKELEEMDRQLKLQVQEFRRQQRRDSEVETQEEKDTQEIAPELSLAASSSFEPAAPPEEVQELQRLKDLAAQMDEAFPEAEPLDGDASAPAPAPVRGGYQELPMDGPLDEEVSHFKTVLDQLDLRLRALQSKQDLHMEDTDTAGNSRSPPQMVAQLQMQNQVLRDMLSGDQRKGRLNFDRKLFGAASTA